MDKYVNDLRENKFLIYKTLEESINQDGINIKEELAIEEMSELIKSILKFRRFRRGEYGDEKKEEILNNLIEEFVDVDIMMRTLYMMYIDIFPEYGIDLGSCKDKWFNYKMNRIENRNQKQEDTSNKSEND